MLSAFDAADDHYATASRPAGPGCAGRPAPPAPRPARRWPGRGGCAGHPRVAAALAAGVISPSWARHIIDWTDRLPEHARDEADRILLQAAADGAELPDLAAAAEQIRARTAGPDPDPCGEDGGFGERSLRLTRHFQGHAHLDADLTPPAASALQAVLDALNGRAGPEDLRNPQQRDHDALEEGCRRLIGGGLPGRAGQPTQIQLHLTLSQLLGQAEADQAAAAWIAANGVPAPPGADCDAHITPVVTGNPDAGILDQLANILLSGGTSAGKAGTGAGLDRHRRGRHGGAAASAAAAAAGS